MSVIITAGVFAKAHKLEACLIATLGKTDLHLIGPRRLYATDVQRHWISFDQSRSVFSEAYISQGNRSGTMLRSVVAIQDGEENIACYRSRRKGASFLCYKMSCDWQIADGMLAL